MYFLFLSLIGMSVGTLFWESFLLQELIEFERGYVAIDNGGIELGRKMKQALQILESENQRMEHFDRLHHIPHLCAKAKQAECIPPDRAMEMQMRLLVWKSALEFKTKCLRSEQVAMEWKTKLSVPLRIRWLGRPCHLEPIFCPVCKLQTGWKFSKSRVEISASQPANLRRITLTWIQKGKNWLYAIKP